MASGDLERVASTLVADGKGILAADETVPTITRRFEALGIKSTEQSRRTCREMLFTSAKMRCAAAPFAAAQQASGTTRKIWNWSRRGLDD